MADVILTHPDLARKTLMKVVPAYSEKMQNFYKRLGAKELRTTQAFEDMMSESAFPLPPVVNESNGIPLADFQTMFRRSYTWRKRGLGYAASSEKVQTDQYGVIDRTAQKLARSFNWGMEVEYHNAFNLGFTSFTTADNQPWFSTAHTLESGTASNRGIVTPTGIVDVVLSYSAVNQALAELQLQVGHRGEPLPAMGPFRLHVNPRNGWIANTLVESAGRAGTSDNDTNVLKGQISMVNSTPYLTSASAWFLTMEDDSMTGLFCLKMRDMSVRTTYVERLDRFEYYGTQIYRVWAHDWRNSWGTTG